MLRTGPVDDGKVLEKVERHKGKGAHNFERAVDLFDVAEIVLELVDDVLAALDLNLQVSVDARTALHLLRRFNGADQRALAHLRTRT